MDFSNVTILVTGSASGIGLSLCEILKKYQAHVIGTFNMKQIPIDIDKVQCDISKEEDVTNLFSYIASNYGKIDAVINVAAVSEDMLYEEKSAESFQRVLNTNLLGTFLIDKYASFNLKKGGVIINMSSTDATDTYNIYSMDYCASKAGVENLTKNFALALPEYRILALAPMWVLTDSVKAMDQNYLKKEMLRNNQQEILHKEDVALKIIEMLINSDDYPTGEIVRMEKNYE